MFHIIVIINAHCFPPRNNQSNPLAPKLNPSARSCLPRFFTGDFHFKELTARCLYKSFSVKGLKIMNGKIQYPLCYRKLILYVVEEFEFSKHRLYFDGYWRPHESSNLHLCVCYIQHFVLNLETFRCMLNECGGIFRSKLFRCVTLRSWTSVRAYLCPFRNLFLRVSARRVCIDCSWY
jgi:hypothetical protein